MNTATGRAVLALDEILCNLTADQAAAFRTRLPTWLRDQTDAAVGAVTRNLQAIKDTGLAQDVTALPPGEHPGWVRLGIIDALVTWWSGQVTTCIHNPHPLRPQPAAAAAWKVGLIVCGHCTHLLELPRNAAADRTCDGCGRITSGPDTGDPIFPFVVNAGVLSYSVGACRDCQYLNLAPARPLQHHRTSRETT